jgi:hypothetical protein
VRLATLPPHMQTLLQALVLLDSCCGKKAQERWNVRTLDYRQLSEQPIVRVVLVTQLRMSNTPDYRL